MSRDTQSAPASGAIGVGRGASAAPNVDLLSHPPPGRPAASGAPESKRHVAASREHMAGEGGELAKCNPPRGSGVISHHAASPAMESPSSGHLLLFAVVVAAAGLPFLATPMMGVGFVGLPFLATPMGVGFGDISTTVPTQKMTQVIKAEQNVRTTVSDVVAHIGTAGRQQDLQTWPMPSASLQPTTTVWTQEMATNAAALKGESPYDRIVGRGHSLTYIFLTSEAPNEESKTRTAVQTDAMMRVLTPKEKPQPRTGDDSALFRCTTLKSNGSAGDGRARNQKVVNVSTLPIVCSAASLLSTLTMNLGGSAVDVGCGTLSLVASVCAEFDDTCLSTSHGSATEWLPEGHIRTATEQLCWSCLVVGLISMILRTMHMRVRATWYNSCSPWKNQWKILLCACVMTSIPCITAQDDSIEFYEWGFPGPYRSDGVDQSAFTQDIRQKIEAGGLEKFLCNTHFCLGVTLADSSLAAAGSIVYWGVDYSNHADELPTASQISTLEAEGLAEVYGTPTGVLLRTNSDTWLGWGHNGQFPSTSEMSQIQGSSPQAFCSTYAAGVLGTLNGVLLDWGSSNHAGAIPAATKSALQSQGIERCWGSAYQIFAVSMTGQVFAWGGYDNGASIAIPASVEAVLEAEGVDHVWACASVFCASTNAGKLRCWGDFDDHHSTSLNLNTQLSTLHAQLDADGVAHIWPVRDSFLIQTNSGTLLTIGTFFDDVWSSDGTWLNTKTILEAAESYHIWSVGPGSSHWHEHGGTIDFRRCMTLIAQTYVGDTVQTVHIVTYDGFLNWRGIRVFPDTTDWNTSPTVAQPLILAGGGVDDVYSNWVFTRSGTAVPLWHYGGDCQSQSGGCVANPPTGTELVPGGFSGGRLAGAWQGANGYSYGVRCNPTKQPARLSPDWDERPSGLGGGTLIGFMTSPCVGDLCAGGFAYNATRGCNACPAGQADLDTDPETPCSACQPGTFSPSEGATTCPACELGQADMDSDPTTACTQCNTGQHSASTVCDDCADGTADTDSSPATPCTACGAGFYAATAATICTACPSGYHDDDQDPSTPCDTDSSRCSAGHYSPPGSAACEACIPGSADEDGDPSTICTACHVGHFSLVNSSSCTPCGFGLADIDQDAATECEACGVGYFSAEGSTTCNQCHAGRADLDLYAGTACDMCATGRFASPQSTMCGACAPGLADLDLNPASSCDSCPAGQYAAVGSTVCIACDFGMADVDQDPATPCTDCFAGTYSARGMTQCDSCLPGFSDVDSVPGTRCTKCAAGSYSNHTQRFGLCDECPGGRFTPVNGTDSLEGCEHCPVGQFSATGASSCDACAGGRADEDNDPATPCIDCPNGTFTACAGTTCTACHQGSFDGDMDSATPCTPCTLGSYWQPAVYTGMLQDELQDPAQCIACDAGQVDDDSDSLTTCVSCPNGQTSVGGATQCFTTGECMQQCPAGWEDADCSDNTPCTECALGTFSPRLNSQSRLCQACNPGSYAPQGSLVDDCEACAIGRADDDGNQWTACSECPPGTFTANEANELVVSNATRCIACSAGTTDSDGNASTVCSPCDIGASNPNSGSIGAGACNPCTWGRWSAEVGAPTCQECPQGTYRGADDVDGCVQCDTSSGEFCTVGSSFPRALPGYFAEIMTNDGINSTNVVQCIPYPYACLGTCSREVVAYVLTQDVIADDDDGLSLDSCTPGLELESCTAGYQGARCSLCTAYDVQVECTDTVTNGYYRLESRCEPCPCTLITFPVIVAVVFIVALVLMFALDSFGGDFVQHASTLTAPMLIIVSFCQTIAAFLDTGIPWPPTLRRLMMVFSFLSFNLEMTRPECAGTFGPLEKVQVAVAMPFFVLSVIGVYGLITLVRIHNQADAASSQKHSARDMLSRKLASVGATLFTVGAIFFAKSFLRAFDCVASELDSQQRFMASAPEVRCRRTDDPTTSEYSEIKHLSMMGMVAFFSALAMLWISMIREHRSDIPGLGVFWFLADKFEDHFYYWELVIVVRKVLLMGIFLLFNRLAAVLLATFLTIFSLGIHIAARPFEDEGTDLTEMLSLVAQLITLVTGPVFVVLADRDSGMESGSAHNLRALLEVAGGITLTTALGISVLVQVRVFRAIRATGADDEHDDFKIRMEARRLEAMRKAVEDQEGIIVKLRDAHETIEKEKREVKAMRKHEPAGPTDEGVSKFQNPLQKEFEVE